MIVLKYVRNQWELSLICSIIAMQFPSRYRMPQQFFYPYFCDQSYVAVKHTSPLIMDAVQIGDRDSKTELLVRIIIQHGNVRTCTFQCRSTSAKEVNNMPRFFKNGLYHCSYFALHTTMSVWNFVACHMWSCSTTRPNTVP